MLQPYQSNEYVSKVSTFSFFSLKCTEKLNNAERDQTA